VDLGAKTATFGKEGGAEGNGTGGGAVRGVGGAAARGSGGLEAFWGGFRGRFGSRLGSARPKWPLLDAGTLPCQPALQRGQPTNAPIGQPNQPPTDQASKQASKQTKEKQKKQNKTKQNKTKQD
jgi:hypothetical protein